MAISNKNNETPLDKAKPYLSNTLRGKLIHFWHWLLNSSDFFGCLGLKLERPFAVVMVVAIVIVVRDHTLTALHGGGCPPLPLARLGTSSSPGWTASADLSCTCVHDHTNFPVDCCGSGKKT